MTDSVAPARASEAGMLHAALYQGAPVVLECLSLERRARSLQQLLMCSTGTHAALRDSRCDVLEWAYEDRCMPEPGMCAHAAAFLARHGHEQRVRMPNCLLERSALLQFAALPRLTELHCLGTLLGLADIQALWEKAGATMRSLALSHCSPDITSARLAQALPAASLVARISAIDAESASARQLQSAAVGGAGSILVLRLEAPSQPSSLGLLLDFCFVFKHEAEENETCDQTATPASKKCVLTERFVGAKAAGALKRTRRSTEIVRQADKLFGEKAFAVVRVQLCPAKRGWHDVLAAPLPHPKRSRTAS